MRRLIDTSGVVFEVGRPAEPKVDKKTGVIAKDKQGRSKWRIQLAAKDASGIEVIAVTVAGDEPRLTVGQVVQVKGLEVGAWMPEHGRNPQFWYSAESITPVAGSKAA